MNTSKSSKNTLYLAYTSRFIDVWRQHNTNWLSIEFGQYVYNQDKEAAQRSYNITFNINNLAKFLISLAWKSFNTILQPKEQRGERLVIDSRLLVIGFSVILVGVML